MTDLGEAMADAGFQDVSRASQLTDRGWLHTGNYALNWAVSGRFNRGYPLGHTVEIFGEPATGKAQPVDTPVMTPDGPVPIGNLQPGDEVIGRSGQPTKVVAVHPQGEVPVYELEFSDSTSTQASGDHLWAVKHGSQFYDQDGWRLLTTRQLIDVGLRRPNADITLPKWRLPLTDPVQFRERDLPIPPYTMGALLGDGCFRDFTPSISSNDEEIIQRIRNELDFVNVNQRNNSTSYLLSTPGSGENPLTRILRNLGLWGIRSENKFIPENYLYSSVDQRLNLLRGLLDTDGSVGNTGSPQFSTTSCDLAQGVEEIVRSLGGNGSDKKYPSRGPNRLPLHHVSVKMPMGVNPFYLSRKREIVKNKIGPNRSVSSIKEIGRKNSVCITVEADDGLYVTEDYLVTHNSFLVLAAAASAQREGGEALIDDTENALNIQRAEKSLGVDPKRLYIKNSHTVEEHYDLCKGFIKGLGGLDSEGPFLLGLDSVGELSTEHEKEVGLDKPSLEKPKKLHALLRLIGGELSAKPVLYMAANHVYTGAGRFQSKKASGGRAFKFKSSVRIRLWAKDIGDSDLTNAVAINAEVVKSRFTPQGKQAKIVIPFYSRPISPYSGIIPALLDLEILRVDGRTLTFIDEEGEEHETSIWAQKTNPLKREKSAEELMEEFPDLLEQADRILEEREKEISWEAGEDDE